MGPGADLTGYSVSDGTGTIRDEIECEYNDFDQVTTSYQSHEGAVNTGTSPKVQYAYDATVSSNLFTRQHRLESVTYPDGRVIFNDYDTTNPDYPSNRLSRVRRIRETDGSGTELAIYGYSGTERLALVDLPEPDFKLDLYQGTTSTYAGMDCFGRVKDQYWDGYNSTADVDRFKYDHDYAGSRTYRDIDSAIYASNDKDQAYTYDRLHRLATSGEPRRLCQVHKLLQVQQLIAQPAEERFRVAVLPGSPGSMYSSSRLARWP